MANLKENRTLSEAQKLIFGEKSPFYGENKQNCKNAGIFVKHL